MSRRSTKSTSRRTSGTQAGSSKRQHDVIDDTDYAQISFHELGQADGQADADAGSIDDSEEDDLFESNDKRDSRSTRTDKRRPVPAFLRKLYTMVDDPKTDELIHWTKDGKSFSVYDPHRLAKEVLPTFFKHSNSASFVRQLNMYGFHKLNLPKQGSLASTTSDSAERWRFQHPLFVRGDLEKVALITRQKAEEAKQGVYIGDTTQLIPGQLQKPQQLDAVRLLASGDPQQVQSLLNTLQAIQTKQHDLSSRLDDLQKSNMQLWAESAAQRERHQQQQSTIDKILGFIARVLGGDVNGVAREAKDEANQLLLQNGRFSPIISPINSNPASPRPSARPSTKRAPSDVVSLRKPSDLSDIPFDLDPMRSPYNGALIKYTGDNDNLLSDMDAVQQNIDQLFPDFNENYFDLESYLSNMNGDGGEVTQAQVDPNPPVIPEEQRDGSRTRRRRVT